MAFQAKGGAFEPVEKTYSDSFNGDKVARQKHSVVPATEDEPEQHHLKRSLQNRHIAMSEY